jgi:hypothetical protein
MDLARRDRDMVCEIWSRKETANEQESEIEALPGGLQARLSLSEKSDTRKRREADAKSTVLTTGNEP